MGSPCRNFRLRSRFWGGPVRGTGSTSPSGLVEGALRCFGAVFSTVATRTAGGTNMSRGRHTGLYSTKHKCAPASLASLPSWRWAGWPAVEEAGWAGLLPDSGRCPQLWTGWAVARGSLKERQSALGCLMVRLLTECAKGARTCSCAEDCGCEQAEAKLVPGQGPIKYCLLAKHLVVFQPADPPMTLRLPDNQPAVGQQVADRGIRCLDGCICQEAVGPGQRRVNASHTGSRCCWQRVGWLCLDSVQLALERYIVHQQLFHFNELARLNFCYQFGWQRGEGRRQPDGLGGSVSLSSLDTCHDTGCKDCWCGSARPTSDCL